MTIAEASKQFLIPLPVFREYEQLCDEKKSRAGEWQCDDHDLEQLGFIITLHGIGFDEGEVQRYMKMAPGKRTARERIQMLNKKRGKILDEIHSLEHQISRLDYLRYELQKVCEEDGK